MKNTRHLYSPPAFVVFEVLEDSTFTRTSTSCIDRTISTTIAGQLHHWTAVGVVYAGHGHFTSRFLDAEGDVWYHDGASTGNACIREAGTVDLHTAMGRKVSHILYALTTPLLHTQG